MYTWPRLAEAIGLLGNSSNKIFAVDPSSFSIMFKAILCSNGGKLSCKFVSSVSQSCLTKSGLVDNACPSLI